MGSGLKIYSAVLTEAKVARPDGTSFYLVESSADVVTSTQGADVDAVKKVMKQAG